MSRSSEREVRSGSEQHTARTGHDRSTYARAVQSIILEGRREYSMFNDLRDYSWVLEPFRYESESRLLNQLDERVIAPDEARAKQLIRR